MTERPRRGILHDEQDPPSPDPIVEQPKRARRAMAPSEAPSESPDAAPASTGPKRAAEPTPVLPPTEGVRPRRSAVAETELEYRHGDDQPAPTPRRSAPAFEEEPQPVRPRHGQPLPEPTHREEPKTPVRRAAPAKPRLPKRLTPAQQTRVLSAIAAVLVLVVALVAYFTRNASEPPAAPPSAPSGPRETIDDTSVTIPEGWSVYADEKADGDRRLIRLRNNDDKSTLQVATLTSIGADLKMACHALTIDQRKSYTVSGELVPHDLTVANGTAVACGFQGSSENMESAVQFTLLQRSKDKHTLVLRSIVPASVENDDPSRDTLAAMQCEAASQFGTPLPLC